jgi:hypothetical protein
VSSFCPSCIPCIIFITFPSSSRLIRDVRQLRLLFRREDGPRLVTRDSGYSKGVIENYFFLLKDMSLGDEQIAKHLAQAGMDAGAWSVTRLLEQL